MAEFEALEDAEETYFLPGAARAGPWGYGDDEMLSWPYYQFGGGAGKGVGGVSAGSTGAAPVSITRDRVPVGEVEVRRGQDVYATDGRIGRVEGLVVDAHDHQVTHVLLAKGHLWGQRDIAIPIGVVKAGGNDVRLSVTKDEVLSLHPAGDIQL